MLHRKFYYQSEANTEVNVPFSWEIKPGVCKVTDQASESVMGHFTIELRPPPCSPSPSSMNGLYVTSPLLWSPQPSKRNTSLFIMGVRKADVDPFLAAYKKCTRSSSMHNSAGNNEKDVGFGKRKSRYSLSCKYSCPVREDNLVRVSRFPKSIERK